MCCWKRDLMTVAGPGALRTPEHPYDVVCMVKHHASDDHLAQQIMLAVPFCRLSRLSDLPTVLKPFKTITRDRRKNWVELAHFVLRQRCNLDVARTARFLLDLVNEADPSVMVPLPWLASPQVQVNDPPQLPSALGRLAPVVKFKATIRR